MGYFLANKNTFIHLKKVKGKRKKVKGESGKTFYLSPFAFHLL